MDGNSVTIIILVLMQVGMGHSAARSIYGPETTTIVSSKGSEVATEIRVRGTGCGPAVINGPIVITW